MSTHSMKELRANLGNVVREVAYSGSEAIITDSGTEIAAVISMDDYERLHEHADVADALHLREIRSADFEPMSMADMLERLGVSDSSMPSQPPGAGEQPAATDLALAISRSNQAATGDYESALALQDAILRAKESSNREEFAQALREAIELASPRKKARKKSTTERKADAA